jgi:adenylate kinase
MSRRRLRPLSALVRAALIALALLPAAVIMPSTGIGARPAWAEPQQAAPVRIILIGPPGAGKSTQAMRLADLYKVPAISTGQLLREAAGADTPEGKVLKATLEKGDLVPDDVVIGLLRSRLQKTDTAGGWVIHGYPRTLLQALALDNMLVEAKQGVNLVVALQVPEKVLVERLGNRLVCKICGRSYSKESNPPQKAGICDADGGELVQRPDDQASIAAHRVEDQMRLHEEMRAYYSSRDIFLQVDGSGDITSVQGEINRELKKRTQ